MVTQEVLMKYKNFDEVPKLDYFWVKTRSLGNNITITMTNTPASTLFILPDLEYSYDGVNWTVLDNTLKKYTINFGTNKIIYLRGNNTVFSALGHSIQFEFDEEVEIGGKIISLIDKTMESTQLTGDYCFNALFQGSKVVYADELDFENIVLTSYCYAGMFEGCSLLKSAPELPAETLETSCYANMFKNCSSLEAGPVILPATKVVMESYAHMFEGCTLLTKTPIIMAQSEDSGKSTITGMCCTCMFYNCSSLNYVTSYLISSNVGTTNWMYGVANKGTFYAKGTNSMTRGANGIPTNWTIKRDYFYIEADNYNQQTTLYFTLTKQIGGEPALPSIQYSIDDGITWNDIVIYTKETITPTYLNIGGTDNPTKIYFKGDNSSFSIDDTNYVNISATDDNTGYFIVGGNIISLLDSTLANTTLETNYTFAYLFNGNNFLKEASNLQLPSNVTLGCYLGMFKECISLLSPPPLPATTLASYCYANMFEGCSSLIALPFLPATTLADYCYSAMLKNCTSLRESPELPATEMVTNCYTELFSGCSYLNKITILSNNFDPNFAENWVKGVFSTGEFYNLGGATISEGDSGIPSNWDVYILGFEDSEPLTVYENMSVENAEEGYINIFPTIATEQVCVVTFDNDYMGQEVYLYAESDGTIISHTQVPYISPPQVQFDNIKINTGYRVATLMDGHAFSELLPASPYYQNRKISFEPIKGTIDFGESLVNGTYSIVNSDGIIIKTGDVPSIRQIEFSAKPNSNYVIKCLSLKDNITYVKSVTTDYGTTPSFQLKGDNRGILERFFDNIEVKAVGYANYQSGRPSTGLEYVTPASVEVDNGVFLSTASHALAVWKSTSNISSNGDFYIDGKTSTSNSIRIVGYNDSLWTYLSSGFSPGYYLYGLAYWILNCDNYQNKSEETDDGIAEKFWTQNISLVNDPFGFYAASTAYTSKTYTISSSSLTGGDFILIGTKAGGLEVWLIPDTISGHENGVDELTRITIYANDETLATNPISSYDSSNEQWTVIPAEQSLFGVFAYNGELSDIGWGDATIVEEE